MEIQSGVEKQVAREVLEGTSPFVSLSLKSELAPFLEIRQGKNVILFLRRARESSNTSYSQSANESASRMCFTIFQFLEFQNGGAIEIASGSTNSRCPSGRIVRGESLHSFMLKNDSVLANRVFGDRGVLQRCAQSLVHMSDEILNSQLIDPFDGLPGSLPTDGDRLIYLNDGEGYEVCAAAACCDIFMSYSRQKNQILKKVGPDHALAEKKSALAYLRCDEEAQFELLRALEPFRVLGGHDDNQARYGQYPQAFVEEFLGGESQKRAYVLGMIKWPTKYHTTTNGIRRFTPEYERAIRSFYRQVKLESLRKQLEQEHLFLPRRALRAGSTVTTGALASNVQRHRILEKQPRAFVPTRSSAVLASSELGKDREPIDFLKAKHLRSLQSAETLLPH